MRVAIVHSFYTRRNPSGEDAVVRAEVAALEAAGHDVHLVSVETDELAAGDRLYPLRAAARVATRRGRDPLAALDRIAPDVVQVVNLFPNLGRTWVDRVERPVVATLHNYRPMCANGYFFRDGGPCTDCVEGSRLSALRHACYRDSRLATLPLVVGGRGGAGDDPLLRRADRVVVLSELMRHWYVRDGVPAERVVVRDNFLPAGLDPGAREPTERNGPFLAVGRLSAEKGIVELVRAWPEGHRLEVVGEGELEPAVRAAAADRPGVEVLGRLPREDVLARLRRSRGLVFPSRWFEGQPLVHLEALATGTPTLAVGPNVVVEMVRRDGTGAAGDDLDDLASLLAGWDASSERQRTCREVFERRHTEAAWVAATERLWSTVT